MIDYNNNGALSFGGRAVFCHSDNHPFVILNKTKYIYKSWRGSLKVKTRIKKQHPLTTLEYITQQDNSTLLKFSSGSLYATFQLIQDKNILKIIPIEYSKDFSIQFNFYGDAKERLFGLGERFLKLNLKGEKIENMVSEHTSLAPILAKAYPFLQKLGLKAEGEFADIKTYCPIPVYTSDKLYALYIDCASYGLFDFSLPNVNTITFEQMPKAIYFIIGENYTHISKGLQKVLPSRQYLPDWVHNGMILGIKGSLEEASTKALAAKEAGIAVSGIWCENWSGYKKTIAGRQVYWNWEFDKDLYPNLPEKIKELDKKGIKFLAYNNPYLLKDAPMYNDYKAKGFLIKNKKGKVYHIKTTTFQAGMIDLSNPEAFEYTKKIITENYINIGVKGWMADFGEYLPHDSVLHTGNAHDAHNIWPVLWARCNREAIIESGKDDIFFFSRSGYAEIAKYSPILWNGDQHTDYSADYGMASVLPATLSLAMSGTPLCHSDIAGFITFGNLVRDKDLWIRWLQMSAFSPLMRSHATPRPDANVQFDYDKEIVQETALFTNIHKLLAPYLKYLIDTEASIGIPVMRPIFYNYPQEQVAYDNDFCYMLGADLFVAPSFDTLAKKREIALPQGDWICLLSGKKASDCSFTTDKLVVLYKRESNFSNVFELITKYVNKFNGE